MSISYPLSLPSNPGTRKVDLTADNIVGITRSPFTGQQQTYQWPGEGWLVDVNLPPMQRAAAEQWWSFLVALRGQEGTFLIGDDVCNTPRGVATGTPLVHGAQGSMSNTLATKGWTHNITGILKAGDYIQLGSGTSQRLYKVLTDANSDSSGYATLDIFPTLREGVSDNQAITTSNCKGCFRLAENQRVRSVDHSLIYGISFKAEEAY